MELFWALVKSSEDGLVLRVPSYLHLFVFDIASLTLPSCSCMNAISCAGLAQHRKVRGWICARRKSHVRR